MFYISAHRLAALAALNLSVAGSALAQSLPDIARPAEPLVLESRGSFYIGGETVDASATQLMSVFGEPAPVAGHITLNQMYVEYMVPTGATGVPVVMVHGGTVTGKSWDTTPDGRMGWYEYFVRRGHPVYVPDQIGRARSGADLRVYSEVRAGEAEVGALPNIFYHANEQNWPLWRFGPEYGEAFPDTQFPVEFADELSKQAVPDLIFTVPDPNATAIATAELSAQAGGAVVMGHSQTGSLPLAAALSNPSSVKGMILIEPGGCGASNWTDEQIGQFAEVPTLVVFGDHLDNDTKLPGMSWQAIFEDCQALIERIDTAGGDAEMLYPPELGIAGNTHMLMQDRNSLEIADLILAWIDDKISD